MLALLALATLVPPVFGPTLPPGTRPEFQTRVLAVTDFMEKGNFEAAKKALEQLPTADTTIEWDDKNVPVEERPAFRGALDRALKGWLQLQANLHPRVVSSGGSLKFSFQPDLPTNPETGIRSGYQFKFGQEPGQAPLEVVIALHRGEPATATTPTDVFNEVAHGFGSYYGLSDSPARGNFMSSTNIPSERETTTTGYIANMVGAHVRAVDELRGRIAKGQKVISARPRAQLDPLSLGGPDLDQGTAFAFELTLVNKGNAPLAVRVFPSCSCFGLDPSFEVAPGGKHVISGRMDTTNSTGEVEHTIAVFTNDIEYPVRVVPVRLKIQPRYRLVFDSPQIALLKNGPNTLYAYLYSPPDRPISAVASRLLGISGTVTSEKWSGKLADPVMNEGSQPRVGTKFTIHLDGKNVVGRSGFALVLDTDDPDFKTIQTPQVVQHGIAWLPGEVYLGEVIGASKGSFVLTQPGQPFHILSITSDSSYIRSSGSTLQSPGNYRVDLEYAGGAPKGYLGCVLTIKTDSPDSPMIQVPVVATVR